MEGQKSDKSSTGHQSKREAPIMSKSSASEHHTRDESKKIRKDIHHDSHSKDSSDSSDDEASEKPEVHHSLSRVGKSLGRMKIENENEESSGESSSGEEDMSWINWFLSQPGNHFYLRIPDEYIEDEFNLAELSPRIPFYKHALDILLDLESASDSDQDQEIRHKDDKQASSNNVNNSSKPTPRESRTACKMLYSLIHSRYLLSRHGLAHMADRYEKGYFGTCPRYYCEKTRVIPAGLSDTPGQARVQVYCPSCNDAYQLPSVFHRVDGAAFGTSFPHIFFKTYPEFVQSLPKSRAYEPKIYGFKLHRKPFHHSRKHSRSLSRERGDSECSSIDTSGFTGSIVTELSSIHHTNSRASPLGSSIGSGLRRSIGIVENMSWIRSLPNYNRDNTNIQD